MTPGPATRTASELPRKSPVPMAPPIAIMPSWPAVSCRESCSPCSMCSIVLIGSSGTPGRIEHTEQSDWLRMWVFEAVHDSSGQVDACARTELAGSEVFFEVQDSAAVEDVDDLFVRVLVERSFALRNPSHELRHVFAAEIGMDEIAEHAILAGANLLTLVFVDERGRSGFRGTQRTAGADDAECVGSGILNVVGGAGGDVDGGAAA